MKIIDVYIYDLSAPEQLVSLLEQLVLWSSYGSVPDKLVSALEQLISLPEQLLKCSGAVNKSSGTLP